jgi:hypothetical protein
MAKSQTIGEMRFHIENIVPSIESFLEIRDDLMPPSQLTRVDLSMYQADPLELLLDLLTNRLWQCGGAGSYTHTLVWFSYTGTLQRGRTS